MSDHKNSSSLENVVIIGGGPAGLAAAIYTARAGLSPLLFAGSPPGGQLTLTSDVENYPGFESILGSHLIENFRNHAKRFGVKIIDKNVLRVDFTKRPIEIYLTGEKKADIVGHYMNIHHVHQLDESNYPQNVYLAKAVIIATGAKALWLNLANEQKLRGKGVSACATCDGFFFKDKVVAVVGGGDTAMEEALTLTKFASKVYIIHRRDQFRASKIMQERVFKNPKVEIICNSVVIDVLGKGKVEAVRLKKIMSVKNEIASSPSAPRDDTESTLKVDGFFLAIGHKPDTEIFKDQIELDRKGYIITTERYAFEMFKFQILNPKSQTNSKLEIKNSKLFGNWLHPEVQPEGKLEIGNYRSSTSVPGVFAAGDCVDYVYRQAGTAVGMGIAAALEVNKWLEISK